MNRTSIEWCDFTVNPIRFRNLETGKIGHYCEKISPGCKNCYASRMQTGPYLSGLEFKVENQHRGEFFFDGAVLQKVLRRRKPATIFWCDMTDLFGDWVPYEWIDRCFATMALTPHLRHLVLTKRAKRMREWFSYTRGSRVSTQLHGMAGRSYIWPGWPLPNVALGVSVENRAHKDRIDDLRDTLAAMRFLSLEPLIEDIGDLDLTGISWVIVGGESGPGARPMHPNWARSICHQCVAAGVPFTFKQWGAFRPVGDAEIGSVDWVPQVVMSANIERTVLVYRNGRTTSGDEPPTEKGGWFMEPVGKKVAGRLLDGKVWDQRPEGWR